MEKALKPRQWREMQDSNLRGFYTRRFSGPFPSTTRTISRVGADGRIGTCIASYRRQWLCHRRPYRASSPCLLHHIRIFQVAALRTDRLFCGPDLRSRRLPADEGLALDAGPDHRIISAAHAPTRCTPKVRDWSDRRALNPQPSAWKADALPIELLPQNVNNCIIFDTRSLFFRPNFQSGIDDHTHETNSFRNSFISDTFHRHCTAI